MADVGAAIATARSLEAAGLMKEAIQEYLQLLTASDIMLPL